MHEFLQKHQAEDFGSFAVDKILLKKSTLTPKGPIYEDVHEGSWANQPDFPPNNPLKKLLIDSIIPVFAGSVGSCTDTVGTDGHSLAT